MVGRVDGALVMGGMVGLIVRSTDGEFVGSVVGEDDGFLDGGCIDCVGSMVGLMDGSLVGSDEDDEVGDCVGETDG